MAKKNETEVERSCRRLHGLKPGELNLSVWMAYSPPAEWETLKKPHKSSVRRDTKETDKETFELLLSL